jgi:hypothetical protein
MVAKIIRCVPFEKKEVVYLGLYGMTHYLKQSPIVRVAYVINQSWPIDGKHLNQ